MLTRRNLLSSIGGLPFLGFLKSWEEKLPNIMVAENMEVTTSFNLASACDIVWESPLPKVEIIININRDGQRFKMKAVADNLTWESL